MMMAYILIFDDYRGIIEPLAKLVVGKNFLVYGKLFPGVDIVYGAFFSRKSLLRSILILYL